MKLSLVISLSLLLALSLAAEPWMRHTIDNSSKGADGVRLMDVNGDGLLDVEKKNQYPTVGEFIEEVRKKSGIRPATIEVYAKKFRTLVAGVTRVKTEYSKYDYVNKGHREWLEKVHSVNLSEITPPKVQAWKIRYIQEHGKDPITTKRAKVSVNSIIRNTKSLFGKKALKFVTLKLPDPLPFEGIELEKPGRARYKSEIEPELLLQAARNELAIPIPLPPYDSINPVEGRKQRQIAKDKNEQYKIFLIALGAGLRRDEIDTLTWDQLDFGKSIIRVETNVYTEAKSDGSEEDVDVDPDLMEILRAYRIDCQSVFVINSAVKPRQTSTYHHYRCERHFDGLIKWLRSKGVTARTAIHSLRKEFGSFICQEAGIFAASVQLRHSNIHITRDHYLDKKERVTLPIGKMLKESTLKAVS